MENEMSMQETEQKKYRIVSDGDCDLPVEMVKELGIDVVPFYVSFDDEHYLKEIRSEIKGKIKKDTYSNKNVINSFKDNLEIVYDKRITYKTNIYNLEDFIKMTPLTSGLSKEQINELTKCDIENITIDLKIIVGKVK